MIKLGKVSHQKYSNKNLYKLKIISQRRNLNWRVKQKKVKPNKDLDRHPQSQL